ncbi:MAG: hypothetical protein II699_05995 [Lachnospiraceae bacterium]|nr:hypothetical protein [Lachnospiraceae bacterium]
MKNLSIRIILIMSILTLVSFTFVGCDELNDPGVHYISAKTDIDELTDATIDQIVDNIVNDMTLSEKVGQMFIVDFATFEQSKKSVKRASLSKKFLKYMRLYPVGGMVYYSWDVKSKEQVTTLNKWLQKESKYPLFIAVDEEGGRVSRVGAKKKLGVKHLPAMSVVGASGDADKCKDMYLNLGISLKKLGFNVDFAPVADLSEADDSEIGDRSFGTDEVMVSDMVESAVKGLNRSGMCSTVKHFPGMRSASSDTHLAAANVNTDISELRKRDFKPFISGIKAGSDFCMISHESVNSITGDTTPATMSSLVIKDILREELGFDGIVITDSMNMMPIVSKYSSEEAAVNAVKAGVDIVMMPDDIEAAFDGIIDAVRNKDISESRINSSVKRIIKCKLLKGIISLDSDIVIDAGEDSYQDIGQMENEE